jgi:TIR domain
VGDAEECRSDVDQRDHLFINYASEDAELARWMTLKLTAQGYRVWCDQFKLLGGESYPKDIDRAIRERTFRMISLLSYASVNKPNPLKERTLGVNISSERGIDFIIPARVDDIRPSELNWHVVDLAFVDFAQSWATGYRKLMKKLESIDTPRPLADGHQAVVDWYSQGTPVVAKQERLWSNLLEFRELPPTIYRVRTVGTQSPDWPEDWPRLVEGLSTWVLEVPPFGSDVAAVFPVDWNGEPPEPQIKMRPMVVSLLRQYVRRHARKRGLFLLDDGSLYFGKGILPKDKLTYRNYAGQQTYVQVSGERTFRLGNDRREVVRYHLMFRAQPNLRAIVGSPVLRLALGLYLTEPSGAPLNAKRAHSRRRRMCKSWYNQEWMHRVFAVSSFLADGEPAVNLALGPSTRIVLAGTPLDLTAPVGIDETQLGRTNVHELQIEDDDDDNEHGADIA